MSKECDASNRGQQAEKAYLEIRDRIKKGIWGPGYRLVERTVAEELGMSRTPVRAAFERLFSEGLVELVPNRGAVVVNLSPEDAIEILQMRQALEVLACRLAVPRLTDDAMKRLAEILVEMEKAVDENDLYRYSDLNGVFHRIIVDASGSKRLAETLDLLKTQTVRHRLTSLLTPGRARNSVAEHEAIVRELARSRKEGTSIYAEEAMRQHIDGLLAGLLYAAQRTTEQGGFGIGL
ncbi:MAG: GntR family transcriptional regulator [Firmicutes bacterium]|nr:GntR family transcriptional regulator [Bacillota bacterium]MDH7495217.1 GntR family transcriptional regulator [Bacillota bacterium]